MVLDWDRLLGTQLDFQWKEETEKKVSHNYEHN